MYKIIIENYRTTCMKDLLTKIKHESEKWFSVQELLCSVFDCDLINLSNEYDYTNIKLYYNDKLLSVQHIDYNTRYANTLENIQRFIYNKIEITGTFNIERMVA